MDVSTLYTVTEELAAYLSEVTQADLNCATPVPGRDIGDLYVHLIDQNNAVARALANETGGQRESISRATLDASVNVYGGGFEGLYRRTAQDVRAAFASLRPAGQRYSFNGAEADAETLYEGQIRDAVLHTWDLAHALGLPYRPHSELALRVLHHLPEPLAGNGNTAWEGVLGLSGRVAPTPRWGGTRCKEMV
ncbi:maleylpyruvate isomerase family mycothiol-dependent enzyme [Nocardia wallacei]|uniref:maleylpyruvate isomerase family mycothiol-dependent enzyme n=1 Tax=Nocardia wallacei TaxID=480035 RepID=UPI002455C50B|nr:maleylpyruvate isomerase family mycothiol-dependent enzyme [Nocardia wallacei]